MPGRPTIFTPAKKDIACALLEVGASRRRAAKGAGIDESVIRYAIHHDEDFAQRVAEIDANLEIDLRVQLRLHAAKSWRANVYCLEMLEKYADEEPDDDTKRKMTDLEAAAKTAEQIPGDTTALQPVNDDTPAVLQYAQKLKQQAEARRAAAAATAALDRDSAPKSRILNPVAATTPNFPAHAKTPATDASPKSQISNSSPSGQQPTASDRPPAESEHGQPPTLYGLLKQLNDEMRRRNAERAADGSTTSPPPDDPSPEPHVTPSPATPPNFPAHPETPRPKSLSNLKSQISNSSLSGPKPLTSSLRAKRIKKQQRKARRQEQRRLRRRETAKLGMP